MRIFIPFNTPSSKNSKISTAKGTFHSAQVRKYLQKLGIKNYSISKRIVENYKTRPNLFDMAVTQMRDYLLEQPKPHMIGFYFIRDSKRKFDFINIAQIICDLLVAHKVIEDDNMDCLIPTPYRISGEWYHVDKEKPGCMLEVI